MTKSSGNDRFSGRRVDVPSAGRHSARKGKGRASGALRGGASSRSRASGHSVKRRKEGRSRRKSGGSCLGKLVKWTVLLVIWGVIAVGGLAAWYSLDLPDVEKLSAATRRPSITLLDEQGEVIATYGDLYGRPVQAGELPPALIKALLATEDRRFFSHFGLDVIGLARALWVNLRTGRIVQGGSTLTQQLAKNLFLTPERTLKRKAQESLLALWLEHKFTKQEILTIYLNRVYLGAGTYGVEAAAAKYFGKSARDLTLYESALIAGLLKAPSRFAPTRDPELSRHRTRQVLANMVNAGVLSPEEMKVAERNPANLRAYQAPPGSTRYFVDWVLPQISSYIGRADDDLMVVTTLDRRLQEIAEAKLVAMVEGAGEQFDAAQAALVALQADGAVGAMVGGRDYGDSQFNRATQAYRQPGSAFKLFVYLAGLESGLAPDDVIPDAPVTVDNWSPKNYGGTYAGPVSLREALSRSINTVAVRVSEKAGRDRVREAARRLGLTATLPRGPSLALGTMGVTLIELTAAYATLANNGFGVWAYGIKEIRNRRGDVLYRRSGSGPGRVIAPGNVARLQDMLSAVISEGTGKVARMRRPVAGKTGTSQNFRDAWFIGYSADLVAGVWFGNDDNAPMRRVTGGGLPARLWRAFMVDAHKGLPPRPLPGAFPGYERTVEGFGPPPRLAADRGAPRREGEARSRPGPGFWARLMESIGIGR